MDPTTPKRDAILVVEDEVGFRECLRKILSPIYEVYTVGNGKEALRCVLANDIDLVMLDLHLRGLSGFDILKKINELKPQTDVIVITGYGTLKNAHEANRFGAAGFISKPCTIADITTVVGKCMQRRTFYNGVRNITTKIKNFRPLPSSTEEEDRVKFQQRRMKCGTLIFKADTEKSESSR